MNFNAFVQIKKLTNKEIEKYTAKNHKKANTSILLPEKKTAVVSIKQKIQEYTSIEIHRTTMRNKSWQSLVQELEIKVEEIEATNIIEVKTEQENQIIPITEGSTFSNHVNNVTQNKFFCEICNTNFNNFEEILVHKQLLHKSKPYVCNVCNAQFVLSAHLYVHQAKGDNNQCMRNLSVNPSKIQSSSKSNLTINPRRNYKNTKQISELAKKSNSTNTSVTLQQNVSDKLTQNFCVTDPVIPLQKSKCKSWKCLNCVFATGSEAKFINHLDICNDSSKSSFKFQCILCIKSFKSQSSLNSHFRYHTNRHETIPKSTLGLVKKKMNNRLKDSGVAKSQKYIPPNITNIYRNHNCTDCSRHFTTREKLNIHQKQHKQQMICNKCHKIFVLKKSFEKHLLSHTKVIMSNGKSVSGTKINKLTDDKRKKRNTLLNSSLNCSHCNIYYKSKQSLAQHNRQHHSISKLPPHQELKTGTVKCNWCSKPITKCNLIRHIRRFHPSIKPLKCKNCSMSFKDNASLKLHNSRFH